jgi:hypothetical protein
VFCDGGFQEVLLSFLRSAASKGGEKSSSISETVTMDQVRNFL